MNLNMRDSKSPINKTNLSIIEMSGQQLAPYLEALAELRIKVFADWPYLYEGTLEYEKNYFKTYLNSNHSFLALAFDGTKLIGATTAILAADEELAFQKPFLNKGYRPESVCYFGESILLSEYRGFGIGKEFMQRRLKFAESLSGVTLASFCSVMRPANHPQRPDNYRPLDEFWRQMGFAPVEGMTTTYAWRDKGDQIETEKPMQFWLKQLQP